MNISIKLEVYDSTSLEEIEKIIGDALDEEGIDCSYDVTEDKSEEREGYVFPFATDKIEKSAYIHAVGESFAKSFNEPVKGHYVGDTVIFVNKDITEILRLNLFKITGISEDKKHFIFATAGGIVNREKADKILVDFRKEQ